MALELALESADYSSEAADYNANPPKIGVWVRAFTQIVGRLFKESADDDRESADAYIPTGESALESANLELQSAVSSIDSKANPLKIGVSVQAFSFLFEL